MAESVERFVVSPPHRRVGPHPPYDGQRASNENQLHHRVVDRDEFREQIQIASQKHQSVQLLSLERNP